MAGVDLAYLKLLPQVVLLPSGGLWHDLIPVQFIRFYDSIQVPVFCLRPECSQECSQGGTVRDYAGGGDLAHRKRVDLFLR